jgi:hypothetical protein
MKTIFQSKRLMFVVVHSVSVFLGVSLQAQFNEKKIERDASGLYKGTATGGTMSVTYDNNIGNFSFAADPYSGKLKVPIKDGKLGLAMSDTDLPGNDFSSFGGKTKQTKVTRGGKKVIAKAIGTLILDEGASKGPWVGASASGDFTDKGSRWKAAATCGAYQRNGFPVADHTKRLSGESLTGSD